MFEWNFNHLLNNMLISNKLVTCVFAAMTWNLNGSPLLENRFIAVLSDPTKHHEGEISLWLGPGSEQEVSAVCDHGYKIWSLVVGQLYRFNRTTRSRVPQRGQETWNGEVQAQRTTYVRAVREGPRRRCGCLQASVSESVASLKSISNFIETRTHRLVCPTWRYLF